MLAQTAPSAPLSTLTTLRLGGPAASLLVAATEAELIAAVDAADQAGEPVVVLAGGSNVVVADEGFPGTVVQVATRGIERSRTDDGGVALDIAAGEFLDTMVEYCVAHDLAGIELLAGIPGSMGATPIQNVGAYGCEVRDVIVDVRAWDRFERRICTLARHECAFDYRTSVLKRDAPRWLVLRVKVVLKPDTYAAVVEGAELAKRLGIEVGESASLSDIRGAVLRVRAKKGMVLDDSDPDTTSAGSFFLNPIVDLARFAELEKRVYERLGSHLSPSSWSSTRDGRVKVSAAWLIERAGFTRGEPVGPGIAISSKHALVLVNRGAGTAAELVALARKIADGVREAFDIELRPEPVFIGHSW